MIKLKTKITVYLTIIYSLVSCEKESPFIPKEEAEAIYANLNPDIGNIAVIFKNDIYFIHNFYNPSTIEKITDSPGHVKKEIKMSYDHQKFAYLNGDGKIEIINRQGELIETLEFTNINSYNWTKTGVLYVSRNNTIQFYGGSFDCAYPSIPDDPLIPNSATVRDLSMSENGDIAYILKWEAASNGYRFVRKPNDGVGTEIVYKKEGYANWHMVDVEYSTHGSKVLLGYQPFWGQEDSEELYLFDASGNHPTNSAIASETFFSPVYRDDIKKLMAVVPNNSYDEDWVIELLNGVFFDGFQSEESELIYIDWK